MEPRCMCALLLEWPSKRSTAGFICYHRSVLEGIDLNKIKFTGYTFQIEMKYAASLKGFKWIEIPIIFLTESKDHQDERQHCI